MLGGGGLGLQVGAFPGPSPAQLKFSAEPKVTLDLESGQSGQERKHRQASSPFLHKPLPASQEQRQKSPLTPDWSQLWVEPWGWGQPPGLSCSV